MDKIRILCTRVVDEQLFSEANDSNIVVDMLPFIATEPLESVEVQQEVERVLVMSATVVFTSQVAVEAVEEYILDVIPSWKIYCTGYGTREKVVACFGEQAIAGTASNATDLAGLILDDEDISEVIFFCGDQRKDELPVLLREMEVDVNEIVVYETIEIPHKVNLSYRGILFFSPSAVHSFFSINKVSGETVLFTIGATTADAVKTYTSNKIIIASRPTKENVFEKVMEYFT